MNSNLSNISVVTICFNNLEELLKTFRSIEGQSLKPLEYIIINGSSNDDIKNYFINNSFPNYIKIISEKDEGISDAFNKGINLSKGDIIHLLNSGDYYASSDVLQDVQDIFNKEPEINWLHGKYFQEIQEKWILSGSPFKKSLLYKGMRQTGHPTMFVKKLMYEKHGLFSLNKKIAMDYDFLIRLRDEPFSYVDKPLVKFSAGGASNLNVSKGLKEVRASYESILGRNRKLIIWQWRVAIIQKILHSWIGKVLLG